MRIVFVSNYINHHQIPFCNAMCRLLSEEGGSFTFIQTQPMEEERVRMGWQNGEFPAYVRCYYEDQVFCQNLILDSEVVLFGGCDEECYVEERLKQGKLLVRISERLYKTGQWKAVSPRGLIKKFHDHTRYRKAPVYLLCAGGYVPSDFHLVRAYPDKMFCWGYFPETREYDIDALLAQKGYCSEENQKEPLPYLLWAGRMIDWKHPELVLKTAAYLRDKGYSFHMDVIGGGDMEEQMRAMLRELSLESCVSMPGYRTPAQVREYMERADIYLFTSDRQEGWGAVANEAMNSGCALVADHMIGAVPYLVRHGENGLIYRDGDSHMLFESAERLLRDPAFRKELGRNAYRTIAETWNAEYAAGRLIKLCSTLQAGSLPRWEVGKPYPCMPAPVAPERKMLSRLCKQ